MKIPYRIARAATALAALTAAGWAQAHPGHGHTETHDLMHVLEAEHVVPVLLAVVAVVLVRRVIRRRAKRDQTRQDH